MKITSKSPSQLLVRLQGKLKVTEKEKMNIFISVYYIFVYSGVLVISRVQRLI